MALIVCEECGKKISNKAKACIHCGWPIELAIYDFEKAVKLDMLGRCYKVYLKKEHYKIEVLDYGEYKMELAQILKSIYTMGILDALEKIEHTPCVLFRDIEKMHADIVIEKLDKLDVEYKLYVDGELKLHNYSFISRDDKNTYDKKVDNSERPQNSINRFYIGVRNAINELLGIKK